MQAAETACLKELIDELPHGLKTVLKERGGGLSEGQIQRLAIARAILSDAPVLLLDECTSALDERTEKQVLKNLQKLKTKTIICISHRPAMLEECDQVIRFGRIRFRRFVMSVTLILWVRKCVKVMFFTVLDKIFFDSIISF